MGGKAKKGKRLKWEEAHKIVGHLNEEFNLEMLSTQVAGFCGRRATTCGSYARQRPTVGDLDIVYKVDNPEHHEQVLLKLHANEFSGGSYKQSGLYMGAQVDFIFADPQSYESMKLHHTGPVELNIIMRAIAKSKGWKLNEYGLWDGEELLSATWPQNTIWNKLGLTYQNECDRDTYLDFLKKRKNDKGKPINRLRKYKHRSDSGAEYIIWRVGNGYWECNCPHFFYRLQGSGKTCKHIDALLEEKGLA